MSRTIPISLQAHLDTGATTTCGILRIEPVRPGYSVIGLTDLDRNVDYDDGDGEVTYLAPVGFTASAYVATADFAVDNAESKSLFPEFDVPQLTEADINAGVYDYARYKLMLVNYEDLTQGHAILSTGTLGEMKTIDGLAFMGELRSLFQQFRQSIVERDSLTCRATFGSQSADSSNASTAPKIERFPCGIVVDDLWVSGSVTQVGVESDLAFASSDLTAQSLSYVPGVVEWETGANAGRQYEVSDYQFTSGSGVVTLSFPTAFQIADGDTFRIRPDCTKHWSGANSCLTYDNRLNFRGEPFIPVGDAGVTSTPGSGTTGGVTGGDQGTTDPGTGEVSLPVTALNNGDFESGNVGWASVVTTFPPFGATAGPSGSNTFTITNSPGNGRSGSDWFARYTTPGGTGQYSTVANSVVFFNETGELVEFSVWMRCATLAGSSARAGLFVEAFSDAGLTTRIGYSISSFEWGAADPEWYRVRATGTGVAYLRFSLLMWNPTANCVIDFDDAQWRRRV
jgi:uncharacterized phage protein (TIGR02218 family)